ncbi:GFA family protein [Zooshikella harenae]|uniref:GFA family protein n=1 Tax=Zooshikella harenae TaxID=2827238 RepID=UPI004039C131
MKSNVEQDVKTAECCCGACTVSVQGNPVILAICHCKNCKKRTGSAFLVYQLILMMNRAC